MSLIIIVIMVDFGIRYIGEINRVIAIIAFFHSVCLIKNMNRHGIATKAAIEFDSSGGSCARRTGRHVTMVIINRITVHHGRM